MSRLTQTMIRAGMVLVTTALTSLAAASPHSLAPAQIQDGKFQPDELATLSVPHVGLRSGDLDAADRAAESSDTAAAQLMDSVRNQLAASSAGPITTSTNVAPPFPVNKRQLSKPILGPGGSPPVPAHAASESAALTGPPPAPPAAHGAPVARVQNAELEAELERQRVEQYKGDLEAARYLRATRQANAAIPLLEKLLTDDKPESVRQSALLELGYGAQDQNELPRAQTVYTQFLNRWPTDARAPEILLRLGQNYRQMGLNNLALAKFYAVMTASLSLKSEQVGYYQKLVLQAQLEVAETNFQMGKYADAAEFFSRLLKQNDPALDRPQVQYRLIRSLAATENYEHAAQQAQDFLGRYPEAPQLPEVRFLLAQAFKQTARNGEALQQVLVLLQEQKERTKNQPQAWAYWQQRAGNEIANQLYRDGDYPRALNVYQALANLDPDPAWQLPVTYQVGMTYERLLQPAKAVETYNLILARQSEVSTNLTPNLKTVFEMARWRASFVQWQSKAENANHEIVSPPPLAPVPGTNSPPPSVASR